ncbi:hypothetical protein [Chroococcidiopsis sp.]
MTSDFRLPTPYSPLTLKADNPEDTMIHVSPHPQDCNLHSVIDRSSFI